MPAVPTEGSVGFARCRRSLIINRSASPRIVRFLVACPEVFWASLMRTSSMSMFVRMGHFV